MKPNPLPGVVSKAAGLYALALLIALEVLTLIRLEPPRALPLDAPASEFSAMRAKRVLERLLPGAEPHPTGTEAQHAVRNRLVLELQKLGLHADLQRGVACGRWGVCAEVENVVAALPGRDGRMALALACHYDSVPAGPGAADDAQGVASVLEMARALGVEPPPSGVALLFSDGEELGLLGARLFLREHPLAKGLKVVLNVEARGTEGPSLMFETTEDSGWLVERFARSAPRPTSSSLFASVYRALPNDTDLTVFGEHGVQGLNFAFLDGVARYHTPLDDLAHLDFGSVQHQGENVLATVRALLESGVEAPGTDAVFFDVLGTFLVHLPQASMWPLSIIATLALAYAVGRDIARRRWLKGDLLPAAAGALALFIAPGLAAASVGWVLAKLGALPSPWLSHPRPLLIALAGLAFGGAALAMRIARAERWLALFDAVCIVWLAGGWVLVIVLPSASYIAVLPALSMTLARTLLAWVPPRLGALVLTLPIVVGALVWLPALSMLYPALGLVAPALLASAFAVGLSPWLPLLSGLFAHPVALRGFAALAAGGAILQLLPQPFSENTPQRLSIALAVDPEHGARFLADTSFGPLPPPLARAANWSPLPADPHPWPSSWRTSVAEAPAPKLALHTASGRITAVTTSSVTLEATLPRGAWALNVHVPATIRFVRARWEGRSVAPRSEGSWSVATFVLGKERRLSVELDLALGRGHIPELLVSQATLGLPTAGAPLQRARKPFATQSQFGDMTIVASRVSSALPVPIPAIRGKR